MAHCQRTCKIWWWHGDDSGEVADVRSPWKSCVAQCATVCGKTKVYRPRSEAMYNISSLIYCHPPPFHPSIHSIHSYFVAQKSSNTVTTQAKGTSEENLTISALTVALLLLLYYNFIAHAWDNANILDTESDCDDRGVCLRGNMSYNLRRHWVAYCNATPGDLIGQFCNDTGTHTVTA